MTEDWGYYVGRVTTDKEAAMEVPECGQLAPWTRVEAFARARAAALDQEVDEVTLVRVYRPNHHEAVGIAERAIPPDLLELIDEGIWEVCGDWRCACTAPLTDENYIIGGALQESLEGVIAAALAPRLRQVFSRPVPRSRVVMTADGRVLVEAEE